MCLPDLQKGLSLGYPDLTQVNLFAQDDRFFKEVEYLLKRICGHYWDEPFDDGWRGVGVLIDYFSYTY